MKEEEAPSSYNKVHDRCGLDREAPPAGTLQGANVSFPPLGSADIKRACRSYADENCCHGSRFADAMTLAEVTDRIAYRYTLESVGEKRETAERFAPYYGGPIDGSESGAAPSAWDIPVNPSKDFQNEKKIVDVPHTSYLKSCMKCSGKGRKSCVLCLGMGGRGCLMCLDKTRRPCSYCYFSGRRCVFCSGHGTIKCETCDGNGKLLVYKILMVIWECHKEEFVTDTMNLPPDSVKQNGQGKQIWTEQGSKLSPLHDVPIPTIEAASKDLMEKHQAHFRNEVIRKQRHTLRAIPFTRVKYHWKEEMGEFYVYGLQKKAYFDNYPQRCCCCCTIS